MKHKRTIHRMGAVIGATALFAATGCNQSVVSNLLLGAHDGAVSTATGIIDSFFQLNYGIGAADGGAQTEEAGGNDLFIHS